MSAYVHLQWELERGGRRALLSKNNTLDHVYMNACVHTHARTPMRTELPTTRLSKSAQESRANLLNLSHKYNSGTISKLTGVK